MVLLKESIDITKHFISEHPEILITHANKGNTSVILD